MTARIDDREGAKHKEEGRNATDLLIWSARSQRLRRALAASTGEESTVINAAKDVLSNLQELVEELQESVLDSNILHGSRSEVAARFGRMLKRESENLDGEVRPSKRSKLEVE